MKTYAGIEATLLWHMMTGGADDALQDGGVFIGDEALQDGGVFIWDDVHKDGGVLSGRGPSQGGGATLQDGEAFLGIGMLHEPAADYAGMLEGMEAAQLLQLMSQVQERLRQLGVKEQGDSALPGVTALSGTATGKTGTVPIEIASRASHLGKKAGKGGTNPATPAPQKLFIGRDYSIRLGSRNSPCMPIRPLVKALFILFLKHPEGILLKERGRYEKELETIYKVIAPNVDPGDRKKRIMRLMSLEDNSFSEKTSVLNATLDKLIPNSAAYKIQGYNGHPRRIPLDPLLIEWVDEPSA